MNDQFIFSLLIGAAAGCFIFVALRSGRSNPRDERPLAVAAFAIGGVVTLFFYRNPLGPIPGNIAATGVAIVFAALAAALLFWKLRSCGGLFLLGGGFLLSAGLLLWNMGLWLQ